MRFNKTRTKKSNTLKLAFKFVSLFLALFIGSYFLLSLTNFPNYLAAITSQLVLQLFFGMDSSLVLNQAFPIIQTPNLLAQIIDLCSGKIEIAVLAGIIFSSFEKRMDYRIKGFLVGLFVMLTFNAFRIALTIYLFDLGNLEWSAIFHDLLFRIFLIIVIVSYYAIWYFYDFPRKTRTKA